MLLMVPALASTISTDGGDTDPAYSSILASSILYAVRVASMLRSMNGRSRTNSLGRT